MIYLDVEDLLYIAGRILPAVDVRDIGLLEAAAARARASAFGDDAYPSVHDKAAALLHSIAGSRALADGNKRLGLAAVIAFCGTNGFRLTLTNDEAFDLVSALAAGHVDDVAAIGVRLAGKTQQRP